MFLSFISEKVLEGFDKRERILAQRLLSAKPRSNRSADVTVGSSARSPVPATSPKQITFLVCPQTWGRHASLQGEEEDSILLNAWVITLT